MSNEITYTSQIFLRNGTLLDTYASGSLVASQSVAGLVRNVQLIATTAAGDLLDKGSVSTPGWAVFVNLDAINYVEIGSNVAATFYPFLKLKPGEAQMCRVAVASPYARANTLAVSLFYIMYET